MHTEVMNALSLPSQQFHQTCDLLTVHRLKRGGLLFWSALFTISAAVIRFVGTLTQLPQSNVLIALLLSFSALQFAIVLVVVLIPARHLLLVGAIVEGCAVLFWLITHIIGLPLGLPGHFVLWRPELLGLTDFYLPFMEGLSALFFLCLYTRTWTSLPEIWHPILQILPSLILIAGFVALGVAFAINAYASELVFATFIFAAGFPTSLLVLFLPIVGLLATFLLLRVVSRCVRTRTSGAGKATFILLPALLLVSLLTWAGSSTAANRGWFPQSVSISVLATQTSSVSYCSTANSPLAMNISEPSAHSPRPAPMVLYIHGGAGFLNSRNLATDSDGVYFTQIRDELLSRGFVVGSIDYPLIPLATGQEMVEDAKCAIRFLRTYANELGINPQRIGVYGDSEGGYIASMLGTTGSQASFEPGQYLNQSSNVQAVADLWGFTDLTDFSGSPSWVHPFGAGESLAQQRAESPISYVAPNDPPFLIIHGTDDGLIALHHSLKLEKLLHASNVPVQLVVIQHGGHGFNATAPRVIQQPAPVMLVHTISTFFVKTLA